MFKKLTQRNVVCCGSKKNLKKQCKIMESNDILCQLSFLGKFDVFLPKGKHALFGNIGIYVIGRT